MSVFFRLLAAFTAFVVLASACETEEDTGPADKSATTEEDSERTPPTTTTVSTTTTTTTTTTAPPATTTTTTPATTTTTTTTSAPATTTAPPATTAAPVGETYFATLPPGSALPSAEWCASRVKPEPETRAGNSPYNSIRGTTSNGRYPRVDGDFIGTTGEIIQWAACKWGIDENVARAQSAKESWWDMSVGGDLSWDQSACHPDLRTEPDRQCPESIGLLQVRWLYHSEAFEDSNTILSTAYNADYTYAVWRDCYDGNLTWLNDVERGGWYEAGDLDGCLGVWFSGRWYTAEGTEYISAVNDLLDEKVWEQDYFVSY